MKWLDCRLWDPVTAKDMLGNEVSTGAKRTIAQTIARATTWSAEELAVTGRTITENERRFLIPGRIPACTHADIDGESYRIRGVSVEERGFTVLEVEKYGS